MHLPDTMTSHLRVIQRDWLFSLHSSVIYTLVQVIMTQCVWHGHVKTYLLHNTMSRMMRQPGVNRKEAFDR